MFGGFCIYWLYGRIRTTREYALMHLIQRITSKKLTSHLLQTELKEIIRERDDIIKDRFDRIIEQCIVLDIDEVLHLEQFFELVADAMSPSLNIKQSVLLELLLEREKESSTVISPSLAIPHIIIQGENTFDILLARCREKIIFSESGPLIQAVFVLAGTKDERNFHLRALSAIAQIVQDPHFEKKWLEANSKEDLRDIVLLGKRRRH